ncbi:MAG TPA: FHA domain-containing protein, partial [Anaerolineales bacterium]
PRVGMKRAVFFITPHMDDANIESMVTPLTQLAIQNNVHVFVWFTDSQLYAATASATAFTNLAQQTGGAYFAVTELQPYPDPESYFAPLRRLYALQYVSAARTGGSHTLGVEVVGQAGAVRSVDQSFTINLEPPNPIFVTPPLQILRSPPADDPYNEKVLLPENQPLELIIEFPDSHPRALVRTTLYVDGQVAAENTAEPFDKFTWDLTAYRETGEHKITVEVVDALGLSKSSIEVPVMVTVIQPPHGISALFSRYRQSIIIGAVAFAGLALLLIIFMGRLRSLSSGMRSRRAVQGDPLTQTIHTEPKPAVFVAEKTIKRPRTTAPRAAATKAAEAPAFLRPLQPDPLAEPGKTFKPAAGAAIPLSAREITFGTDPKQSSYVLADASLDPRHARITRNENGDFFVVDAGTIGGTWVNFEPVGPEAHLLRHGDVLHFGQLVFRFELKEPPPPAEPKVTKLPP